MTASSESTTEVSTLQEKTNCFSKIGNGIKCLLILGHISAYNMDNTILLLLIL